MIRLLAALVSAAVAFTYLASMVLNWDHFGGRSKRISAASCLVFFVLAYGFIEAWHRSVEMGPRVYAVGISLLILLGALLWRFSDEP